MYTAAIRKQLTLDEKSNYGKHGHDSKGSPTHGNLLSSHLASATQSTHNEKTNLCYNWNRGTVTVSWFAVACGRQCGAELMEAGEATNSKKSQ
jgi:hypothetical protein